MSSASIAPLNWFPVGKGGPSVLLRFCSPGEHKLSLTVCHEATVQQSGLLQKQETRGKSELLKPFLLPNALVQTTDFIFAEYHTVWC